MKKILPMVLVAIVLIVTAVVGYSFFRTPEEASQPIEAQSVAVGEGFTVFQIVPESSEARFIIDEELTDGPKRVVGATDQVAGEIAIDVNDPSKTQIGTIQVNARTLTTDSDYRNRAIKNRILQTDEYEFVTFTPTELSGLPASATVGESYEFQIVGDLTVRDVTKQVTFDATVTPTADNQLEGLATTSILYADYGLAIPNARSVVSVEDDVILELEFVAQAN